MHQYTGLVGILAIFLVALLMSNNRKAINWRLVTCGISLQVILAMFILKLPLGKQLFHWMGVGVEKLLGFADQGAGFVFGPLVSDPTRMTELFGPAGAFIFAFKLVPTIIFVAALASIAYHIGLMQRVVKVIAWIIYRIMGASGAEALSNAASVFVGQVEAQLLIKPYVSTLTMSELLAVMAGSMACIAGGVMAVYIQMGIPAEYLMAASIMAIPGALVISKIVFPETETSLTRGEVKLDVEKTTVNIIDAAAHGAADGLKIGLNVCAMLIAFIAIIGLLDFAIGLVGQQVAALFFAPGGEALFLGLDLNHLSINGILGALFFYIALALGVPFQDAATVGSLMGTKMVLNEFVAYSQLAPMIQQQALDPKSVAIVSFALCGFANFSSIAMQIGGIGEMAPERKHDLARLGLRAMLCGTMASYVSSAIAGVLFTGSAQSAAESSLVPLLIMMAAASVIVLVNLTRNKRASADSAVQPAA
jgi:concentrative nucleoside transporter, CNT family